MRHESVFVLQPKITEQENLVEIVFARGVCTVCGAFVEDLMMF
jgi:hypothetical protein